jgi:hypothetical protein
LHKLILEGALMGFSVLLAGLAFGLGGALVVALADARLSRLLLIYVDAVEGNVGRLVEAVRAGTAQLRSRAST